MDLIISQATFNIKEYIEMEKRRNEAYTTTLRVGKRALANMNTLRPVFHSINDPTRIFPVELKMRPDIPSAATSSSRPTNMQMKGFAITSDVDTKVVKNKVTALKSGRFEEYF